MSVKANPRVQPSFGTSDSAIAALIGAASGAAAVTLATNRFAWPRDRVAFSAAALAFAASRATGGAARAAFEGATLAAIGLGIAELVRSLGASAEQAQQPTQATPPPEAIKRADLETAIADVQAKNTAVAEERDEAHVAQVRQIEAMVSPLVEELRRVRTENAELRATLSTQASREAMAPEKARPTPNASVTPTRRGSCATAAATVPDAGAARAPLKTVDLNSLLEPDAVQHLMSIFDVLDPDERRLLSTMNATAPANVADGIRAELLARSPAAAADYLRRCVFPRSVRGAEHWHGAMSLVKGGHS
jgi:hypothetical protein